MTSTFDRHRKRCQRWRKLKKEREKKKGKRKKKEKKRNEQFPSSVIKEIRQCLMRPTLSLLRIILKNRISYLHKWKIIYSFYKTNIIFLPKSQTFTRAKLSSLDKLSYRNLQSWQESTDGRSGFLGRLERQWGFSL